MKILIKNTKIIDSGNKIDNELYDILISEKGIVERIEKNISPEVFSLNNIKTIESGNLHTSASWIDFRAFVGVPGYEYIEDYNSLQDAAKKGGFKSICIRPDTLPVIDNKAMVNSVMRPTSSDVQFFQIGSVTKNMEGVELSEMNDMFSAGVTLFFDPNKHLTSDLLKKALLYCKSFNGTILHTPFDPSLVKNQYVHEGKNALSIGLKGISDIAESIIVERDLQILEEVGGNLHLANITTKKSVDIIRKYKKKGLQVTADTALHYLIYNDSVITDFDSNYKVFPPFRSKEDVDALIEGVLDNTIDIICSDHSPQNIENKKLEFDKAAFGISSIETFYSSYQTYLKNEIPLHIFISKITKAPSIKLGKELPSIIPGNKISCTCFDPDVENIINEESWKSKSKNNALIGKTLKGKVIDVI